MAKKKAKYNKIMNVVRPDSSGRPDDIVLSCDSIHLERMSDGGWWMGVYRHDTEGKPWKRISIWLAVSKNGKLRAWIDNEDKWPLMTDQGENEKNFNPTVKVAKRLAEESALPQEAETLLAFINNYELTKNDKHERPDEPEVQLSVAEGTKALKTLNKKVKELPTRKQRDKAGKKAAKDYPPEGMCS